MIAAVDTNILLDILVPDDEYLARSKQLLDKYLERGQLVICEVVFAELAAQFPSGGELEKFLFETGIRLVNSGEKALHEAGRRWLEYVRTRPPFVVCQACGAKLVKSCPKCNNPVRGRQRVVADFIIGAHALVQADLLVSRDRGFYRMYFKDLAVAE